MIFLTLDDIARQTHPLPLERNRLITSIFRAVLKSDGFPLWIEPKATLRPPGNISYLVDNLWEWARPETYPNRRRSAYASPTPELARTAVGQGCTVGAVEGLKESSLLAQVSDKRVTKPTDSKFHPDVKALPKLVNQLLGREWMSLPLEEKKLLAPLWAPCIEADEVNYLLEASCLNEHTEELRSSVTYWGDVVLFSVESGVDNHTGEIFFEYPSGYQLVNPSGSEKPIA